VGVLLVGVLLCVASGRGPGGYAPGFCQVAGISAAGLLLPCSLIDMAFDTDFLTIAAQAMLAAFACALMLTVWTGQE
jgi:hypothetical protein